MKRTKKKPAFEVEENFDISENIIAEALIKSTEYIKTMKSVWDNNFMQTAIGKSVSRICFDYYDKYGKAPGKNFEKALHLKIDDQTIDDDTAETIEAYILRPLNEDYDESTLDIPFIVESTKSFFQKRQATILKEDIEILLSKGKTKEALDRITKLKIIDFTNDKTNSSFNLADKEKRDRVIAEMFNTNNEQVLNYKGAIGEFWNGAMVRGSLVGILARDKMGKCVEGNQKVLLSTGEEVKIKKLFKRRNKNIISFNEKKQIFEKSEVSNFWKNGKKKVYKVTTKSGREVITTINHPYLTLNGWKNLEDISIGEFITVPKKLNFFGTLNMSDQLIRLYAYLIADGCLSGGKVSYTKKSKSMQKDFTECVQFFDCSVRWEGITGFVNNSLKNKRKPNRNYIEKIMGRANLSGKLSHDKTIPSAIFKLRKAKLALFLRALYSGDGWIVCDGSEIGYSSVNKELCYQVQSLLTRFGIISCIIYKNNEYGGSYTLAIRDYENIVLFHKEIGFLFEKQEKLNKVIPKLVKQYKSFNDKFPYQIAQKFHDEVKEELLKKNPTIPFHIQFKGAGHIRRQIKKGKNILRQSFASVRDTKIGKKYFNRDFFWDEIVSISYEGLKETYDLTVDTHHNFIANNVIVHNTFLLLDMFMQACKENVPVAFIQAGDMTENQQAMRIAIYLAQKSNKEEYSKAVYLPVKDCIKNQANTCSLDLRQCFVDLQTGKEAEALKQEPLTREQILGYMKEFPEYEPCFNCSAFNKNKWGTTWLRKKKKTSPLGIKEAKEKLDKFFTNNKQARIETYANGSCTLIKIKLLLEGWRLEGFEPALVLLDYGDLIVPEVKMEFRHQQDYIWRGLRGLSQTTDALWIVPTQADADSYTANTLTSKNFSEDKRKNAHVTAMFGLNQDKDGVEKDRGVMRINKLVFRDGDFHPSQQVTVIQCLAIGRPILDSFF